MVKKQSLWFLTLFSLILVLSVYYITMPNELLKTNNSKDNSDLKANNKEKVVIKEDDVLATLRVEVDDERTKKMTELKTILTNAKATVEEKNEAFEKLKLINTLKGKEEVMTQKIKEKLDKESLVQIDGDQIRVTVIESKHDVKLANNIMRTVQEEFDTKMYISVKFQK